jgi:hypothetical protein
MSNIQQMGKGRAPNIKAIGMPYSQTADGCPNVRRLSRLRQDLGRHNEPILHLQGKKMAPAYGDRK